MKPNAAGFEAPNCDCAAGGAKALPGSGISVRYSITSAPSAYVASKKDAIRTPPERHFGGLQSKPKFYPIFSVNGSLRTRYLAEFLASQVVADSGDTIDGIRDFRRRTLNAEAEAKGA